MVENNETGEHTDDHSAKKAAGQGPAFTIFIPTYNRALLLPLALKSLREQTFRDFDVVVVDDGSTDETAVLISSWQKEVFFPIKYIYQQNQGKPSAHNRALEEANGEFFMTLDSNDSLLPEALEKVMEYWNLIPEKNRNRFAGIGGLCLGDNGALSGTPYPEDILDSDYLQLPGLGNMRGEKREAIRTSVLREFPYPIIEGENHIRPTMIFMRMSLKYRMRFINVPLQINRHAPDGITNRRFEYRMKNPKGLRLCFLEQITLFSSYLSPRKLLRSHVRYVRYSLHSNAGYIVQAREVKHPFVWLLALPGGTLKWMRDLLRKAVKGL